MIVANFVREFNNKKKKNFNNLKTILEEKSKNYCIL